MCFSGQQLIPHSRFTIESLTKRRKNEGKRRGEREKGELREGRREGRRETWKSGKGGRRQRRKKIGETGVEEEEEEEKEGRGGEKKRGREVESAALKSLFLSLFR